MEDTDEWGVDKERRYEKEILGKTFVFREVETHENDVILDNLPDGVTKARKTAEINKMQVALSLVDVPKNMKTFRLKKGDGSELPWNGLSFKQKMEVLNKNVKSDYIGLLAAASESVCHLTGEEKKNWLLALLGFRDPELLKELIKAMKKSECTSGSGQQDSTVSQEQEVTGGKA